ncbi:MAG: hypothetical protein HY688_04780 [Chloroflexi bacterium]|nr:hypothetical protein [Chloroflexota bacterium]
MPEAPELAVVREVLKRRLSAASVLAATVLRPTVLRSLAADDFPADIVGRSFLSFSRYGKTLTLGLSGDRSLVVIPMLTGRLMLAAPKQRVTKDTFLVLSLSTGQDLRYLDDR